LLVLTAFSVFAQEKIKVDSSGVLTVRIDPSNAVGGNVSDFFSEVNYIPLETTAESTFGSIYRLVVTDDYYIILDQNTHCILFFTKDGKFHNKIKSKEGRPIDNFLVNKFTKQVVFSYDNYQTYTYCDYNGKIIKTIKLAENKAKDGYDFPTEVSFYAADKAIGSYYNNNNIDPSAKDYKTYSRSLIIYVDDKNKVFAQGLPFKPAESELDVLSTGLGPLTDSGTDAEFFYSKAYDYAIYTLTPKGIKFSYKFVFPIYASLPNDFLSNTTYNKKRIEWLQRHHDAIYCLGNFFKTGNNLIFNAAKLGDSKEGNLIYNLKSGTLIAYKHILQDERSSLLPIYDPTCCTFDNTGILACSGGCLYTSISALTMFKTFDDNAGQQPKYNQVLTEYFKKNNKKDNPVLLRLKLKEML